MEVFIFLNGVECDYILSAIPYTLNLLLDCKLSKNSRYFFTYFCVLPMFGATQVAQSLKNPPAMQETWVRSMGQEDPLEKEMATDCSILAWEIPWTEEPGRLQSMGLESWT